MDTLPPPPDKSNDDDDNDDDDDDEDDDNGNDNKVRKIIKRVNRPTLDYNLIPFQKSIFCV